jgi:hypothetical protein
MRGSNWGRNIAAAGGAAVIQSGHPEAVRLVDVPSAQGHRSSATTWTSPRGPCAPAGERGAALEEIAAAADRIPVFRVTRP